VVTPPGPYIIEVGLDYVLGVSKDDLGVERLELYELARTSR